MDNQTLEINLDDTSYNIGDEISLAISPASQEDNQIDVYLNGVYKQQYVYRKLINGVETDEYLIDATTGEIKVETEVIARDASYWINDGQYTDLFGNVQKVDLSVILSEDSSST